MRKDLKEFQNIDVLPMATAQKVKTMIIQRQMKPGEGVGRSVRGEPFHAAGGDEVPESGERGCDPPGKRNLCQRGNRNRGGPAGAAFHQSGESD